jgi:large subunit ribosomal protein L35
MQRTISRCRVKVYECEFARRRLQLWDAQSFGLTLCLKNPLWTMHGKRTNKAAKKRFRVTATGKIKRTKAGKNHILTKKTAKRKNDLAKPGYVHAADMGRVKRLLGIK